MDKLSQVDILTGIEKDLSLLNSRLISLHIEYLDNRLIASVRLQLDNNVTSQQLTIVFKQVKEYSFTYSDNYSFYNVENYKFLALNEGLFLSLDPADDSRCRNLDDQDYILAEEIAGYIE